jgi:thiamine transport system ATP-binding protein
VLALEDVQFAYPGHALDYRFTLTAAAGEITAIRGASGSGKSTLLDLIAGFRIPTSGCIMVDGTDITTLPPERRPVSILFQSESLFDHLGAAANVALGLPRGTPRAAIDQRVTAALADVGLPGLGAQRAATLSGGQAQRVALARTLVRDRPVLLLDEPFSALDDESRATTRDLVRRLTRVPAG